MAADLITLPEDTTLNVEGKANVPLCPMCTGELVNAEKGYEYRKNNPDTRWFFCETCDCHLGYHRMKKRWQVDPYDLEDNNQVRAYFGLGPVETD